MTTIPANSQLRLLPEEFIGTVLSLRPAVAVFDCDGTLWRGDAGSGFMVWSITEGLVSRNVGDWIDSRYRLYHAGEVSELAICGEMVQMYDGLRETELRRAAGEFFRLHVAGNVFSEMRDLVASLKSSGTDVWAVSSTNHWVIEAALSGFGISSDRILAARVQVVEGVATSRLLDVPTDEGKVASLARAGVEAPDAVFGNSIHDAAMLAAAAHAFPVNPTAALLEIAARNRWPVFYPSAATASEPS